MPLTASATLPDEARRLLYERALDALRSGEATRTGTLESTREFVLGLLEETTEGAINAELEAHRKFYGQTLPQVPPPPQKTGGKP